MYTKPQRTLGSQRLTLLALSMGGNISPLNKVPVNCHHMSPKLWPHPATLSVFKPFVLQSPDAFCPTQAELPSSHSHADTAFYTLNVLNHNTVVLPFCRSAQKIEFMLGTCGRKTWSENLGVELFWNLTVLVVALVVSVLRGTSHDDKPEFPLLSLHSPHVSLKH